MATTSFRTRTTQQHQQPPPPPSRQWFRLSTISAGNSATATATATTTTIATATATTRPPTPQDQKPSSHVSSPTGSERSVVSLPTGNGRSTPPVTSPKLSNPKIPLVTLSPPAVAATSSPIPSPSPSLPSPTPSLTSTKEAKTNTTPSLPVTPVQNPTFESRVTQPSPSPKSNKNNEPQAPYSSPSKVLSKVLSSPTTPPGQVLAEKLKTDHKHYTTTATPAAVAVDEEGTEFISFAGKNGGAVFVDIVASPNKHKSFKYSSSDDERRRHGYSKNEHPSSLGGLGAFANSNVQGVNNSLLVNSSFLHHDPGVHIIHYDTITSSMK